MAEKGLRFNKGKIRYDLVPESAVEGIAKVLTYGADKYTIRDAEGKIVTRGDNNWRYGLPWLDVKASMMRHIAAWTRGIDYDFDENCEGCVDGKCKFHSGELHIDHILTNAAFLKEYYHIYPQGDNRLHSYLKTPRIGLDVDEVICDFIGAWTDKFGQEIPEFWNFDPDINEKFDRLKNDKEFWMNLKPKINPSEMPFEPYCYITARPIPVEWTTEWIYRNGFPTMPVYSVGQGQSKIDIAKAHKIDIFVDDRWENFVELNNAGICTFLMDAPHNKRYKVGYKRISSLNQLV